MKRNIFAAAAPFASLLGLRPSAARAEGDDRRDARRAEEDEDDESTDAKRVENDDGDDKKDSRRAENDDEENRDARRAEDGDDGDEEDEDEDEDKKESSKRAKKAASAERQRCARIVAHGIKLGTVEAAGVMAFDTDMSASAAISALDATAAVTQPAKARAGLRERMATVETPNPGAEGAASPMTAAQQIVAANNRRLGVK